MGIIKTLAKTYGNYFFTMQGLKVMKTMKKDDNLVDEENQEKVTIELPVMAESLLDGKAISEIIWPEEVLIIAIIRNGVEKIPKGRTVMMAGDILVLLLPEKIVGEVKESLMKHTSVE